MKKRMWKPLVIAMAVALALGSAVVYADKPVDGKHGDHGGGATPTPNITAFNFGFEPNSYPEGGAIHLAGIAINVAVGGRFGWGQCQRCIGSSQDYRAWPGDAPD